MQSAHGWNESQAAAGAPERAGYSSHLVDRGADFHGTVQMSGFGTGLPFYGYVGALQFTGHNAAVASYGNLVLLGICGPGLYQHRHYAAIRPGRWGQLRQRIEHFVRLQNPLFMGRNRRHQSDPVGTDDKV